MSQLFEVPVGQISEDEAVPQFPAVPRSQIDLNVSFVGSVTGRLPVK